MFIITPILFLEIIMFSFIIDFIAAIREYQLECDYETYGERDC